MLWRGVMEFCNGVLIGALLALLEIAVLLVWAVNNRKRRVPVKDKKSEV